MGRCEELARVTATPGSIERVYLSPEHARVNRLAAEWMRELVAPRRADEHRAVERLAELLTRDFPALTVWPSRDESDPLRWGGA